MFSPSFEPSNTQEYEPAARFAEDQELAVTLRGNSHIPPIIAEMKAVRQALRTGPAPYTEATKAEQRTRELYIERTEAIRAKTASTEPRRSFAQFIASFFFREKA